MYIIRSLFINTKLVDYSCCMCPNRGSGSIWLVILIWFFFWRYHRTLRNTFKRTFHNFEKIVLYRSWLQIVQNFMNITKLRTGVSENFAFQNKWEEGRWVPSLEFRELTNNNCIYRRICEWMPERNKCG